MGEPAVAMQFEILTADEAITHVAFIGRLDVDGVNAVQDRFVFATAPRRKPTIVDLSRVPFLASMGIGMLLGVAKALQAHGVPLILCAPPEMVGKTLHAAGIHRLIPITATLDEAKQHCK